MGAPHLRPRSCGHLPRFPNTQALRHFALVLVVDFRSALGRLRPHGGSHRAVLPNRHRVRIVDIYPREMNCDYAPTSTRLSTTASLASSRESEIDMPNPFHVTYLLPPAFERLVESLREIAIASARAKAIMERISAPQGLPITLDEMPKNEAWRQLERECRPTCDLCCHYQAHPPRCQLSKRSISPKQYSCKKYSPKHNHRK